MQTPSPGPTPKLLRHLPKFTYQGLSIILSFPSRFDDKELLTGPAGYYFKRDALQPDMNIHQCDVRLISDNSPLLPNTKCVLLMGEKAHRLYTKLTTTLDENRGNPVIVNGIPCISTFTAQDAVDFKDYEKAKNPYYETANEYLSEEIAAGEIVSSKGRNKTKRRNYKWWIQQDTKKAIRICHNGGKLPAPLLPQPDYILTPSSNILIDLLSNTKNDTLHIDIETDFHTLDIRCIAFSFENTLPNNVYVFPVLDVNYKPAYDNLPCILRSLSIAFRDNTTVAHNGAMFDFFVFAYKYHIPVGRRVYDTMIAQHRIYPDIEKSLGHSMSLWTYEPYHKNEGNHSYMNNRQAEELMLYCGKDVYGMKLVKKAQENLMANDPGLKSAIEWSNRAIRPYLTMSYLGMKFDEELRRQRIKYNDRYMLQLLRCMRIFMGTDDLVPLTSNKKCVQYFHGDLGYSVMARGKDGPSLKEEALLKLKITYPGNPVIDFLIKYRGIAKETSIMRFKPWIKAKDDNLDYSLLLTGEDSSSRDEELDGGEDEE